MALSLVYEKRKHELLNHSIYVSIFAIICSLPILAPIIRYSGYNPFTDIFTYLAQGQWLQHHAFAEKVITSGFYPAQTQIALYQATGSRMGGTFFLGYVQSLFALEWSYYAYIPTVAVGFVSGCLAIGGIIRQIVPVRRNIVLALALLPSLLMNGFVFGAEWGFFPQTFGLAFAAGVCALFPYIVSFLTKDTKCKWSQITQYTAPVSLSTAGLLFAYNEPFPIFAVAIGLFLLITMSTNINKIKTLWTLAFIYFIEVVLLTNYEFIRIIKNIYQTLSISNGLADIGWPVLWSPIQFLAFAFGMKSPFNHSGISCDYIISTWLAPVILLVMLINIIQFMKKQPKRQSAILFLFCIEFVLLIFFIKFRYLSPSKSTLEIGHTFLQFKIVKYAAPFSIALLGVFIAIVWQYLKNKRIYFMLIYGLVFVVGIHFHCVTSAKNYSNHFISTVQKSHDPFAALLNLRAAVSHVPSDKVIHVDLGSQGGKLRQMVAYILYDRKISSDYRDDGYILGNLPKSDANMSSNDAYRFIILRQPKDTNDQHNQLSGPFVIQKPPFYYISLENQVGGYNTENNDIEDTWNWVNHEITFNYRIVGRPREVRFKCKLNNTRETQAYVISLKNQYGVKIATYKIQSHSNEVEFATPWITLPNADQHLTVHVETDRMPIQLSSRDTRIAAFMITNARLSGRI